MQDGSSQMHYSDKGAVQYVLVDFFSFNPS